ncbi:hypothetical protein H0X10_03245 [Candidatus Saccharibacteria bacterium]|nr:hypothetical protein [Candidatus Saccharibacteria bacterium]
MKEIELPLNDMTRDRLLIEGLNRYVASDREHPAARFYVQDSIRQQKAYEATQLEQEVVLPSHAAMQLVLFST